MGCWHAPEAIPLIPLRQPASISSYQMLRKPAVFLRGLTLYQLREDAIVEGVSHSLTALTNRTHRPHSLGEAHSLTVLTDCVGMP